MTHVVDIRHDLPKPGVASDQKIGAVEQPKYIIMSDLNMQIEADGRIRIRQILRVPAMVRLRFRIIERRIARHEEMELKPSVSLSSHSL